MMRSAKRGDVSWDSFDSYHNGLGMQWAIQGVCDFLQIGLGIYSYSAFPAPERNCQLAGARIYVCIHIYIYTLISIAFVLDPFREVRPWLHHMCH